jgi:hypothetical protein
MPKKFSANQYAPLSYLLDEVEQVDTSEDHHHSVALQHPQSCNELAPLVGEFSDEHKWVSLFYSEHEQYQGQQGAYNGSSLRQGQQLLHQEHQDQEQQFHQQQEYEARLKNLQAPSPFLIQHMQNLQNQEGFSRIVITAAVAADPSSKSSSTSSSSGPSQRRQRMIQTRTHATADASPSARSSSSVIPNVASTVRVNTLIPTMPMLYAPSSSIMFHNPSSAMMYQEGAFNRHSGSSSGPAVMQLADPSLQHVPVQHHPMMLPFGRQQGFDVSADPLQRAQDITNSIGQFPLPSSSFSQDASAFENILNMEKKCYSRIVEAGISSSRTAHSLTQETSPSTSSSSTMKKEKEEDDVLRPLSAYNFFFCDERDRLLKAKDSTSVVESYDERKERLLAQHVAKDRSKRRPHRKTHGKITFTTLSKLIGQRWRQLPEVEKKFFKDVAKADLLRYQDEMAAMGKKKQDMLMAPIALCYDQEPDRSSLV